MLRNTNVYQYWKSKQYDYPVIAWIAKDYLPIPATSVPSESVFSQGSDVVTKKRNKLTGDSISIWMIVCLKAWGIYTDEDEEEEVVEDEEA